MEKSAAKVFPSFDFRAFHVDTICSVQSVWSRRADFNPFRNFWKKHEAQIDWELIPLMPLNQLMGETFENFPPYFLEYSVYYMRMYAEIWLLYLRRTLQGSIQQRNPVNSLNIKYSNSKN